MLISLLLVELWSCSLLIFAWNLSGKRCLSTGIPSRRVRLPTSVRNSEKHLCLQALSLKLAFPRRTRVSSSRSLIVSGSGPSSSSSPLRLNYEGPSGLLARGEPRPRKQIDVQPSHHQNEDILCFSITMPLFSIPLSSQPPSLELPARTPCP